MHFDAPRFFRELDQRRRDQDLSWRELGRRLEISPSTFSRMSQGKRPDIDTFMKIVAWIGVPAETYMNGLKTDGQSEKDTMSQILQALRSDSSLAPEAAEAVEDILRVAYRRFSQP